MIWEIEHIRRIAPFSNQYNKGQQSQNNYSVVKYALFRKINKWSEDSVSCPSLVISNLLMYFLLHPVKNNSEEVSSVNLLWIC